MSNPDAQLWEVIGDDAQVVSDSGVQHALFKLWARSGGDALVREDGIRWTINTMRDSFYRRGENEFNENVDIQLRTFERALAYRPAPPRRARGRHQIDPEQLTQSEASGDETQSEASYDTESDCSPYAPDVQAATGFTAQRLQPQHPLTIPDTLLLAGHVGHPPPEVPPRQLDAHDALASPHSLFRERRPYHHHTRNPFSKPKRSKYPRIRKSEVGWKKHRYTEAEMRYIYQQFEAGDNAVPPEKPRQTILYFDKFMATRGVNATGQSCYFKYRHMVKNKTLTKINGRWLTAEHEAELGLCQAL